MESNDVRESLTSSEWWSQGVKGCSSQLRAQEQKFCIYLVVSTRHHFPSRSRAINPGEEIIQLYSDLIPSKITSSLVHPLPRANLFKVTESQLSNMMEEKQKNEASSGFSHFFPQNHQYPKLKPTIQANFLRTTSISLWGWKFSFGYL